MKTKINYPKTDILYKQPHTLPSYNKYNRTMGVRREDNKSNLHTKKNKIELIIQDQIILCSFI